MDLWPHLICGLDGFGVSLGLRPCWICGLKSFIASVDLSFTMACGLTDLGSSAVLSLRDMWPGWMCALSFGLPCWIQAMAVLVSPWIWVFSECGSSMVLGLH